ncbi:MAG: glycosyltransferase family 2 protein [Gloeobacteraceae cyanobacterium ES-bin-144]|nr:glycosyltransferase family 2 protein [Verrucomicrobiales bacterium]
MKQSVIISTYNQPDWLNKVLHGYLYQTFRGFEVLIADDGSDQRTNEVIENFRQISNFPIRHVWHADEGYRRQTILNIALLEAQHEYIIMTDGDCIPRRDFLAVHACRASPGKFLSGGYCKLPMDLSLHLTLDDIESGRCFDASYLRDHGLREFSPKFKISLSPEFAHWIDKITPTKATWNNCNASGWKSDLIAVNGFNEDMQYGGADRELGERLANYGVIGLQVRYQAIVLHLDHKRGYKTPETMKKNQTIRDAVIASGSAWCDRGIVKGKQQNEVPAPQN